MTRNDIWRVTNFTLMSKSILPIKEEEVGQPTYSRVGCTYYTREKISWYRFGSLCTIFRTFYWKFPRRFNLWHCCNWGGLPPGIIIRPLPNKIRPLEQIFCVVWYSGMIQPIFKYTEFNFMVEITLQLPLDWKNDWRKWARVKLGSNNVGLWCMLDSYLKS